MLLEEVIRHATINAPSSISVPGLPSPRCVAAYPGGLVIQLAVLIAHDAPLLLNLCLGAWAFMPAATLHRCCGVAWQVPRPPPASGHGVHINSTPPSPG
jgi:hypothetical protein